MDNLGLHAIIREMWIWTHATTDDSPDVARSEYILFLKIPKSSVVAILTVLTHTIFFLISFCLLLLSQSAFFHTVLLYTAYLLL